MKMKKAFIAAVLLCVGCAGVPKGVTPVDNFQLQKYMGHWYEIARLDHSFERGLTFVTAEYSLLSDGTVRVLNRGYSTKEGKWKEAEGKAKIAGRPDQGFLKVSFFGPFYGSYVILELDAEKYSYALVCGPDRSYLWLLARKPRIDDTLKNRLIIKAATLGFDTSKLIYVQQ